MTEITSANNIWYKRRFPYIFYQLKCILRARLGVKDKQQAKITNQSPHTHYNHLFKNTLIDLQGMASISIVTAVAKGHARFSGMPLP